MPRSLEDYLFEIDQAAQKAGFKPLTSEELQSMAQEYQKRVQQGAPPTHMDRAPGQQSQLIPTPARQQVERVTQGRDIAPTVVPGGFNQQTREGITTEGETIRRRLRQQRGVQLGQGLA